MAVRLALYVALPCLAETHALEAKAAAAVAAVSRHFLVGQGNGTRRLAGSASADPFANLDEACQAEIAPLMQTLSTSTCQQEFAKLNQMQLLTKRNVEEMCTSSCFDKALELLDHDCFAEAVDGGSRHTNLGLGLYVNIVRSMCVKNEHGDYCGTTFGLFLNQGIAEYAVSQSEQCSAYEDMGCCFVEVADIISDFSQQLALDPSIDIAAVARLSCHGYDIADEKCPESFGLSTGVIVGIVLGSVAGLALIGAIVFCAIRAASRKNAPQPGAQPGMLLGQPQRPQHADMKEVAWPEDRV